MENSDLLMQAFQYVFGVIPGDIAGNIVSVVTVIVTICTLIIRFWKEPDLNSKWHKLWQILHVLVLFYASSLLIWGFLNILVYGQWHFSLIAWGIFASINLYALSRIFRGIEKTHEPL